MLEFKNVGKWFEGAQGRVDALSDVSLSLKPGELLAVRGPSGCGKTTLLLVAGGLLSPTSGQVTLNGRDPYELNPENRNRLRARNIGFVFQQFHLIPYLTVRQNIQVASVAVPANEAAERTQELVNYFGLDDRADHVPAKLSTGERQRTALARALLNRPKVILADEPTGNLDEDNAKTVLGYLSQYVSDGGCVLLVTHDVRAAEHATRTLQMSKGRLIQ
ncbi:MAG: ABC transporter ATP-binding protein [Phycisphaerales bacterium]|nr:MAG: ABC transporter ATP-binding protein [Phycisphaerales bacterium]